MYEYAHFGKIFKGVARRERKMEKKNDTQAASKLGSVQIFEVSLLFI